MRRARVPIVFLGPSLAHGEAATLLAAEYRAPARQGDVFRALADGARTIVLIDGVFEGAPSVWHHELIAAHRSGVRVVGSTSMGALRAAELPGVVEAHGRIARAYVSGKWNDDAFVALLHGDASSGFRALTVPHVNVLATLEKAVRRRVLAARQGAALARTSELMFYQARTWSRLLDAMPWPQRRRDEVRAFVAAEGVDLKAEDARACLRHVARRPAGRGAAVRASRFSSFVRRVRLGVEAGARDDDATRRLLLADFARQAGVDPDEARVSRWETRLGEVPRDLRRAWAEALALDEMVLEAPARFVNDGPSGEEGAALGRALRAPRGRYRRS